MDHTNKLLLSETRHSALQLFHHILEPVHAAHLLQHPGVDHAGHLLVEARHLCGIHIFGHVAALKQPLDAAHLLDHGRKLGILRYQLLHLALHNASALSHAHHPALLLAKQLGTVTVVQLAVRHTVHHRHHAHHAGLRLLFAALGHKVLREARYHAHDLRKGTHFHDILELLVHVANRELAVFDLLQQLLVVLQIQFGHLVDEALHVAHA